MTTHLEGATPDEERRSDFTFYAGTVRIPEAAAADTQDRSWTLTAEIEVEDAATDGAIAVMGGAAWGWSLYLARGVPSFCRRCAALRSYVRAPRPLPRGPHTIRLDLELRAALRDAATGGIARLIVDQELAAQGEILRDFGGRFDPTSDCGGEWIDEEAPAGDFAGRIVEVRLSLGPQRGASPTVPRCGSNSTS